MSFEVDWFCFILLFSGFLCLFDGIVIFILVCFRILYILKCVMKYAFRNFISIIFCVMITTVVKLHTQMRLSLSLSLSHSLTRYVIYLD